MNLSSAYKEIFTNGLKINPLQIWKLLQSAKKTGKTREIFLFAWWEILHKLKFIGLKRYIQFNSQTPYTLPASGLLPENWKIDESLNLKPSPLLWQLTVRDSKQNWLGFFFNSSVLYQSSSDGITHSILYTFPSPPTSLFITLGDTLFVCCSGIIYRGEVDSKYFEQVLTLSNPISYFLFSYGMTELPDGTLLLGEYGSIWLNESWKSLAYLYKSVDNGKTWCSFDFLIRNGVNKHIHIIRYSNNFKNIILTDGDNKKQAWINLSLRNFDNIGYNSWQKLNPYQQSFGGYLSIVDTAKKTLLGSDYLGGTNFIGSYYGNKKFKAEIVPDPYRRSPVVNLIILQSYKKEEIWAVLHNSISSSLRSLLMRSTDDGKTWQRIIDYDGTQHEIKIVSCCTKNYEKLIFAIITRLESGFSQKVYEISSK